MYRAACLAWIVAYNFFFLEHTEELPINILRRKREWDTQVHSSL
jgi:hypothetical protein